MAGFIGFCNLLLAPANDDFISCMHVLGRLEKIVDPQRKAHA
jgi:hypothetical protein